VFSVRLRALSVIVISVLIALLPAASALGQDPGDPSAGSPPGVVYQLPFDHGRGDAAPTKGKGGGDGSAGSGGSADSGAASGSSDDVSFYRSENNFGSSSQVPGASGAGTGKGGSDAAGTSGSGGSGSSLPTSAGVDSGNTSVPESIGLLALIGAVGAGVAFMAIRARRHGP
jgi:hypothetical protein